jgi:CO/xanthine dehydrogenase Mo-binding subunit
VILMAIGKSVIRKDAEEKITGKALYIDDVDFPGQYYGKVIRSPHPCAVIKGIAFDEGLSALGVVTLTSDEIAGENVFNNFNMDVPFLPRDGRINYVGEPVMLVAARDRETLEAAENYIHVDYALLEPALTIWEGMGRKQLIYGEDNILKQYQVIKGDIDSGFDDAEHTLEGTYDTPHQEHLYIEPQGIIAVPAEDRQGVTIYGSLQCPYYVRLEMQRLFTFPPEKIRVVQYTTGGAFGGKEHFPSLVAGHAALLSLKAGRPIKMIYERGEDIESSTKRHPSHISIKTGVDEEGRLLAMDVDIIFNGGAYSMATPVVLARGTIAGCGAYSCPNVRIRARAVATNTVPTSAFRGFGAPQVFYAMELHMTKVAAMLGQNPYSFKMKNMLKEGDYTATGQHLHYSVGLAECMEAVKNRTTFLELFESYQNQPADLRRRRGIGIAGVFHGAGFTGKGEDRIKAKAGLTLCPDGSVRILCGTTEMGQGMRTVLPQIVAEALQIPLEHVAVEITDTDLVPNSGPTVASRTTMIVGKVITDSSHQLLEALTSFIATDKGIPAGEIDYREGFFLHQGTAIVDFAGAASGYVKSGRPDKFYDQYSHPPFITWDEEKFAGDAYAGYGWAATVAEVEVDMDTFEIDVLRLVSAHDMGKAINPMLVEGQIDGGTAQALGYALFEELRYAAGRIVNRNMTTYIIPSALDVPPMENIIIEKEYPYGPFGAKGLGETPLVVPAGAIASAVRQATGFDVDEIPLTPEKLFIASGRAPQ